MATSTLLSVPIADFLEWHDSNILVLNPYFQRRSVWTPAAKSYLIDTILRHLPVPKFYIRTIIDLKTRAVIREVVDGQQRLRAIIEFASNSFVLDKRSKEFTGLTYSGLDDASKNDFLSYSLGVDQLINATDNEVLEIFARLNSYNVKLNPQELRHSQFQGDFKWSVHEAAKRWSILWDKFGIYSISRRARMLDDELVAQMFGILLNGIVDGNQENIKKLYSKYDGNFDEQQAIISKFDDVIKYMTTELAEAMIGPVVQPPHFLIFFAAVAHALFGIPQGEIQNMPERDSRALDNRLIAIENITDLSAIIDSPTPPTGVKEFLDFWTASKSSTTRRGSRSIRFPMYYRALLPERL